MVKADDFCSFYGAPTVRIRDWRLGAADYAIRTCVVVYIAYSVFAGDALLPVNPEVIASLRPCVLNATTSPVLCKSKCEDLYSAEQCALLQFPSLEDCTSASQDAFLLSRDQLASCAALVNEDGFVGMSEAYVRAQAADLNCSRLSFGQTLRGVFSGDVLTEFDILAGNAPGNLTLMLGVNRSIENPTRAEVAGYLTKAAGLVAPAVPGSVIAALAANMRGSGALLIVQKPARTCFRSQVHDLARPGGSDRLVLTTGRHHYVQTKTFVDRPIDREDLVTGPQLRRLGSSFVQDITLNDISVLFTLLNVQAQDVGAYISSCPANGAACTNVRPINIEPSVGPGGVVINQLTVRLSDLLLRAGTNLTECAENRDCRVNINIHLTNNVLAALWQKGLFFAGQYGDVKADLRIHKSTAPEQAVAVHARLSPNVSYVKFEHGIDVILSVTPELAVFSWSALMVFLGAAVGMLAVSGTVVTVLATSPLFVGYRSGFYQTYLEMESADMSYVEEHLVKRLGGDRANAMQVLATERRKQMLTAGQYELSPRGTGDSREYRAEDRSARQAGVAVSHWREEKQAMVGGP